MKRISVQIRGYSVGVKNCFRWVFAVGLTVLLALFMPLSFDGESSAWADGHGGKTDVHGKGSAGHGKSGNTDSMAVPRLGIISRDASLEMFHKAIRVVDNGEIWIDQQHLKLLLHRNGALTDSGEIKCLSAQDKKNIQLITEGYKNREIGEVLCLSEHTIKAHVSRIFKLLNVRNRSQLVNFAKEYNSDLQQI